MNTARIGDWMQTASGLQFWPLDPRPDEIRIEDIAFALSNLCRYGGHCQRFYSVAEHSVLVSYVTTPEHALCGLLHDATEAYCVDIPRPLKRFLPEYQKVEGKLWHAVADAFALPREMPWQVTDADTAVLLAEKPVLMGTKYAWDIPGDPADVVIQCLPPNEAARLFMRRYMELIGGQHG